MGFDICMPMKPSTTIKIMNISIITYPRVTLYSILVPFPRQPKFKNLPVFSVVRRED